MNDKVEILDTLTAANSYLNHLQGIARKIEAAEEQILETSKETEMQIQITFNDLLTSLTRLLTIRRDQLIERVHEFQQKCLLPLQECQNDVHIKINKTKDFINEGEGFLAGKLVNLAQFHQDSSLLGSLPEVPELKEVPYISFQFDSNIEKDLEEICCNIGTVSRIAPIQISKMNEKPGAILVEWEYVDNDEHCFDIQEFRLQRAFGDALNEKHLIANFSDCFIGLENKFLVKDLQANQPYSFRVCCKFEGSNDWSRWSFIQVATTSIQSFSWRENDDFILTNDNKIATPVKKSPSMLISAGPQFAVGNSVEFTYLECNKDLSTIGLIATNNIDHIDEITTQKHSFYVNSQGCIYIDDLEKSTKLPQITKGLKICFTCESIHANKIRVNIDSCEKRVTYDWIINENDQLYFVAFLSPGTKIMVE